MKKQDNHKKPRKLMDQVRDVMRLNRNRERISRILSKPKAKFCSEVAKIKSWRPWCLVVIGYSFLLAL
jgi:hypothetical protein